MNTIMPGSVHKDTDPRFATTGQPGHANDGNNDTTFDPSNPSGLRVAVSINGMDSEERLLIPVEMLPSIVEASLRFKMDYIKTNPSGNYEHVFRPVRDKELNSRYTAASLIGATLYETSTLRALITVQRMEDAAAAQE